VSFLQESLLGDITRGGQLLLHFLRMIGQVIRKFGGAGLAGSVFFGLFLFIQFTTEHDRYVTARYYVASLQAGLFGRSDRPTVFRTADGRLVATTVNHISTAEPLHAIAKGTVVRGLWVYALAFTCVFAFIALVVVLVWRMGWRQRQERLLRGGRLIGGADLARELRRARLGGAIELAGVPLLKGSETSHVLVTGTSGSGKTVALHALLKDIRARRERVICFSPSGDFIRAFYRTDRDVLLNPFDARCPSWNLWDDCPRAYDYDLVAGALVPDPVNVPDPFWNTAARTTISSLAQAMARQGERDVQRFLELLSTVSLGSLHQYLRGTEAAALLDPDAEKPALSIRSTAVTYARALKYLPPGRPAFHLREWVLGDDDDRWVFLNATDPQMTAVRPLLSMWLEILTNSLLSLPESGTRRIWLVIDELPSLHKIPSLPDFLARARKHGGCGVIAFQTIAQMRESYGRDAAESIAGLCSTWLCLRQPHHDTAKWVARSFGDAEILEANQGLQYGANDMRDGVSLSNARRTRPLLLDSEVMTLPNLEGFLKMSGQLPDSMSLPAARVRFPYRSYAAIADAFIPGPVAVPAPMPVGSAPKSAPPPFTRVASTLGGVTPPLWVARMSNGAGGEGSAPRRTRQKRSSAGAASDADVTPSPHPANDLITVDLIARPESTDARSAAHEA
jgi:type IV conjugative transfer system coupling protein TraD